MFLIIILEVDYIYLIIHYINLFCSTQIDLERLLNCQIIFIAASFSFEQRKVAIKNYILKYLLFLNHYLSLKLIH